MQELITMTKKLQPWTTHYEENMEQYDKEHIEYMTAIPGEEPKPKNQEQIMYEAMQAFANIPEMARSFLKIQPLYYNKSGLWWMWHHNKKIWELIDETDILIRLDKVVQQRMGTIAPSQKSMIMESLKREARKNKPTQAPITWIQFEDCIIDLEEENIVRYQPDPGYFITNYIPHRVGMNTETPVMDKIIESWVGEKYVSTAYEIISYCMLADYPLHRIFALHGSGSNGKSCYLDLLRTFIGEDNVTSSDLDLLLSNRFEVAKLHRKLACLMGETNWNEMKRTALLKRLSGGDLIRFEYKNKSPFDGENYAKIIIATNSLPVTQDRTDGFYRRWMILDFPNKFSEKKDILATIPQREYECLARKCIGLLKKLLRDREFSNEGSVADRRQKYEDVSNPLQKFIREKCVDEPNSYVFKFDFINRFNDWQLDNGYRVWSKTQIGKMMNSDYHSTKEHHEENEKYYRAWEGLRWKKGVENHE